MIRRLDNPVRRYDWGSVDAIPRLLGVPPDGEPQAELWLGAHERAASSVRVGERTVSLLRAIEEDPEAELGPRWGRHRRMPFLAKVIATARPLSLQVHPDAAHASRWYAEEEARGVDPHRADRSCPDDVAKAEMVWALSEFRALCGFRATGDTADWLAELGVPALRDTADALRERGTAALREQVVRLMQLEAVAPTVASVRSRADELAGDPVWGESAQVVAALARMYPEDPAVLLALLLRPVVLQPGDAMFVRPGQPHSYLSGTAFELQANSDNVVRAGLTRKHVDAGRLVDALDTQEAVVSAIAGVPRGEEQVFAPDTCRFALGVLRQSSGDRPLAVVEGPQVFLCLDGEFELADADGDLVLRDGQSAYAAASSARVRVRGAGTLLRVTAGRAGEDPSHERPQGDDGRRDVS